jgi:hypothetical protein
MDAYGVSAAELSDDELERQRVETHATREWALRRGTDEQFHRHTVRLLELEQESLRRHLRRQALEWHAVVDEATRLGNALRGLIGDMEARLDERHIQAAGLPPTPVSPPVAAIEPPPSASAAVAAVIANRSWAPDPRSPGSTVMPYRGAQEPAYHHNDHRAEVDHWVDHRAEIDHRADHWADGSVDGRVDGRVDGKVDGERRPAHRAQSVAEDWPLPETAHRPAHEPSHRAATRAARRAVALPEQMRALPSGSEHQRAAGGEHLARHAR